MIWAWGRRVCYFGEADQSYRCDETWWNFACVHNKTNRYPLGWSPALAAWRVQQHTLLFPFWGWVRSSLVPPLLPNQQSIVSELTDLMGHSGKKKTCVSSRHCTKHWNNWINNFQITGTWKEKARLFYHQTISTLSALALLVIGFICNCMLVNSLT